MKKLNLLLGFLLFASAISYSQTMKRYEVDKHKHFTAGLIISVAASEIFYHKTKNRNKAILFGIGMGVLAGAAKEIYDSTGRGNCDAKDFLWTATGASLPCLTYVIHI